MYHHTIKFFYIVNGLRNFLPVPFREFRLKRLLSSYETLTDVDKEYVSGRVDYYNKLSDSFPVESDDFKPFSCLRIGACFHDFRAPMTYILDSRKFTRFFDSDSPADWLFGDVTSIPPHPTFTKSRPVSSDNLNSVILPLDIRRHFRFVRDRKSFREKKNMLIGRSFVEQPHRMRFMEMYFGHPMCDLGSVCKNMNYNRQEWITPKLPISAHLDYKFILCLEGNDVATNIKWVMSSNSLAVCPVPRYETWFMEGKLIPDYHFVAIKADFSDLIERMNYYIEHPEEAEEIIRHAHEYVAQFFDSRKESLISLMVIDKYLNLQRR